MGRRLWVTYLIKNILLLLHHHVHVQAIETAQLVVAHLFFAGAFNIDMFYPYGIPIVKLSRSRDRLHVSLFFKSQLPSVYKDSLNTCICVTYTPINIYHSMSFRRSHIPIQLNDCYQVKKNNYPFNYNFVQYYIPANL